MKKVGIITFHNSYNCGSMLESYAMQTILEKCNMKAEIVNFSSDGQKELYSVWFKNNSIRNIIKNIMLISVHSRLVKNNNKYEEFKNEHFKLSKEYKTSDKISEKDYSIVVAGSDQIWNITIKDSDDAYFLNWVKKARKVAYSPSFGAKNILQYSNNPQKYIDYLNDFDALSIRENNGKKWLKELVNKDVEVLLDPTMLLDREDYDKIMANDVKIDDKYIFFYSPGFDSEICSYVKKIADKYNLKVITWSTKRYCTKRIKRFSFSLPEYENPAMYLYLMKNAELVITTSYHGTIFSTIYRKKFITVKNGEMYGDDDRVITLLEQMNMMDRLIPYEFKEDFDYLADVDYSNYDKKVAKLRKKSMDYIYKNIGDYYNETSK